MRATCLNPKLLSSESSKLYPLKVCWDRLWCVDLGWMRVPTLLLGGHPHAPVWISALQWISMGSRVTVCPTLGCRGNSAPVPEASPPSPSSLTSVSAGLFLLYILTRIFYGCYCPGLFSPFLALISQRCFQCWWWAKPWPSVGPSWSWLALAWLDTGKVSSSFRANNHVDCCCTNPVHRHSSVLQQSMKEVAAEWSYT